MKNKLFEIIWLIAINVLSDDVLKQLLKILRYIVKNSGVSNKFSIFFNSLSSLFLSALKTLSSGISIILSFCFTNLIWYPSTLIKVKWTNNVK